VTPRVLVVDTDPESRSSLVNKLSENHIDAVEAASGRVAFELACEDAPDIVVTELFLEDITGLNLCRRLREDSRTSATAMVVVSHYADEMDRIIAFEAGIDDFVSKPFSANEVIARIKSILRCPRQAAPEPLGTEATRSETLDPAATQILVCGSAVDATPRERQILAELIRQEGRVVPREELIERLWPPYARVTPRTVDAHIKSLRRKLGSARSCIRTIHGIGYLYEPTDARIETSRDV